MKVGADRHRRGAESKCDVVWQRQPVARGIKLKDLGIPGSRASNDVGADMRRQGGEAKYGAFGGNGRWREAATCRVANRMRRRGAVRVRKKGVGGFLCQDKVLLGQWFKSSNRVRWVLLQAHSVFFKSFSALLGIFETESTFLHRLTLNFFTLKIHSRVHRVRIWLFFSFVYYI